MSIYHKVMGEGYPVVMIHGWTLDHQVMFHSFEPLFEERSGWKRIYIDLPGMGRSEAQPSIRNSDDILEAILRLLDELIPEQSFIICGNSYGGYIARGVIHARREKVRGLLLVAPLIIPDFAERKVPPQTILKRDSDLLSRLSREDAEEFGSMGVVQCQTEWKRFRNEILLPSKRKNADFVNHIRENGYGFTFNLSSGLVYPVLIITGRQDHIVGYHDAWRLIEDYPRATFAVLDMAGHNLQIEQADVFNTLVNDWLNRVKSEFFEE
ncbi:MULTISPECIES: alpha/beta fold hydrolase [unclassified Sporosarcina]|uniref:alpha/beta fold hydrolase n=1 Tax=unclassified Sporosarcina TaxID=2647733 RepID=UPI00203B863D|nr:MULTISPECIES: alpha/beta hydrolase [unclassified Sporosarcina]GKV67141.1 2-hydroxy-6-oxo-6-phenylhexa-2,4-dienoate hydrolase [Sporosarcina sp. NCCP-2331]GLB57471.1 2-hydroxy-6-oxo-6-phenylhexa-2,4-dienoate hydrolase [Sporosarcina sp. NCCP-2378]